MLTAPIGIVLDAQRNEAPVFGIPSTNDGHGLTFQTLSLKITKPRRAETDPQIMTPRCLGTEGAFLIVSKA